MCRHPTSMRYDRFVRSLLEARALQLEVHHGEMLALATTLSQSTLLPAPGQPTTTVRPPVKKT